MAAPDRSLEGTARRPWLAFAILAVATSTGIAGIEVVLPTVPRLSEAFGGSPGQAQLVIASYVAGGAVGMACFGELGARFDARRVLAASLLSYAALAALSAASTTFAWLVAVRFVQGAMGVAAVILAPGMVSVAFPGTAVREMGRLGTVNAVVAVLSPALGQWLCDALGWRMVLLAPGLASLSAGGAVLAFGRALPGRAPSGVGNLRSLLRRPAFLRLAVNQALARAALLTFAFGAPIALEGGEWFGTTRFVVLRILGTAAYMSTAIWGWRVSRRLGAGWTTVTATTLSTCAAVATPICALSSQGVFPAILACWMLVNVGQGLREPVAQVRLVDLSHGDPARAIAATSLIGLSATSAFSAATATLASPGLVQLGSCAALVWTLALLALLDTRRRP